MSRCRQGRARRGARRGVGDPGERGLGEHGFRDVTVLSDQVALAHQDPKSGISPSRSAANSDWMTVAGSFERASSLPRRANTASRPVLPVIASGFKLSRGRNAYTQLGRTSTRGSFAQTRSHARRRVPVDETSVHADEPVDHVVHVVEERRVRCRGEQAEVHRGVIGPTEHRRGEQPRRRAGRSPRHVARVDEEEGDDRLGVDGDEPVVGDDDVLDVDVG